MVGQEAQRGYDGLTITCPAGDAEQRSIAILVDRPLNGRQGILAIRDQRACVNLSDFFHAQQHKPGPLTPMDEIDASVSPRQAARDRLRGAL